MEDNTTISPADPRGSPEREQQAAGVGILLQIMMLVLSFVLGHVLRRHKFYYLPEASASLLIGLVVGGLANISNTETNISGTWINATRCNNFFTVQFGEHSQATMPTQAPENQHIVDLEQLIKDEMEQLPTITSKPCICKIPQNLRDLNPIAYVPFRVAIGPYHAYAELCKSIEPHKLRYLRSLMSRSEARELKDYIMKIEEKACEAWECYSGIEDLKNQLDFQKFKRMLLLDAAFILEVFCRRVEMGGTDWDEDDSLWIFISNRGSYAP